MTKKDAVPQEKSIAVKEEHSLAEFHEVAGDMSGLVSVRSDILKIPRIKLTQKMSNVYGELAQEGDFASEVLGVNYGTEVTIIPICISESASYLNKDTSEVVCYSKDLLKNGDGVLCKDCPHNQYWNDWSAKTPGCKLSIDVVCLVKTADGVVKEPVEMNFRKMNYKAGKAIVNSVVRDAFKVPFGSEYKLLAKQATKDQHKFYVVSDVVERKQLDLDTVKSILPLAKNFLEMKKRGMVETEPVNAVHDEVIEEAPDTPTEDCPL